MSPSATTSSATNATTTEDPHAQGCASSPQQEQLYFQYSDSQKYLEPQEQLQQPQPQHQQEQLYRPDRVCQFCGRTCQSRGALKIHMRCHTGERPYCCPFCSYQAHQRSNLNKHIRIHTGEKPYACPHCSYRSNTRYNLKVHLATHGGGTGVEENRQDLA